MNASYRSIILAISVFFAMSASISAAPGDLDLSFGSGGIVVTSFSGQGNYDAARTVLVQPDGKIVVCGRISDNTVDDDKPFFLARYDSTGVLDPSFGAGGRIISPTYSDTYVGNDMALQPDGKIVTVGGSANAGSGFMIYRYNANGTLDASFGTGGIVITQRLGVAYKVAIQPDGKIVVVGNGGDVPGFSIARYHPDGSLDTSFNGSATAFFNSGVSSGGVFLQNDGKILVAGSVFFIDGTSNFVLVRYNADGSLDSGFGTGGKVTHAILTGVNFLSDAALQPNGKIVASGWVISRGERSTRAAIVRYDQNGSLDTSFAANGVFLAETDLNIGNGITLQPDGKLLAFGSEGSCCQDFRFAVLRLNPNGTPDPGFGPNGRVTTPINSSSFAYDGVVQPDGKILAFGLTYLPGDFMNDVALVRYLGDPTPTCANPIDCAEFFVRQHYQDFLNREPDAAGLAFWTNEITSCGFDPQCVEVKRINVSAAYFLSIEFQQSGYLVYRFYKAAFGNLPGAPVPLRLNDFLPDAQAIGQGVVVNQGNWEQQLETNKQNYANAFVQRSAFTSFYPTSMTPGTFVDTLFANAGVTPSSSDRAAAVAEFGSAANTEDAAARARALRLIAENSTLQQQEFNRAFVLMQYFGYLRRNPNDAPEPNLDYTGYNFWLNKLNQFNGNFQDAEMVKAFLVSTEYRQRFGP